MMNKVTEAHLDRMACVYIRQSTIQQVRQNQESRLRQQGLVHRAVELGWPADRVISIDEDLGRSAAVDYRSRTGFMHLNELLLRGEVGMILAVEISRLVREDLAWTALIQRCRFGGVLLADEQHVYDPIDPHDDLMVGMLATLAGYELNVLHGRMKVAWQHKAERGALYCGSPPGYVIEREALLKSPDRRVRQALEVIFAQFPQQPTVGSLCVYCAEHGVELPICEDAFGRHIRWREPDNEGLRRLLRNPTYAGTYVLGRRTVKKDLDPDGHIHKRNVELPMDEWPTVIHNHHEPYISWEQFVANHERLERQSPVNPGSAHRPISHGQALLAGLLCCARCGHHLYVRYPRPDRVDYCCLGGGKQRGGRQRTCFSFHGEHLEQLVSTELLEVVRPAGVEAAAAASKLASESFARERQILVDKCDQCRYESHRVYLQYDEADPLNRLVCTELERRWNEKLTSLAAAQAQLASFEQRSPAGFTAEQHEDLLALGRRLDQVWFAPEAPMEIKKQILRVLIEHIVVDVDAEGELQVRIHWHGNHESAYVLPSRTRGGAAPGTPDLVATLDLLRLIADDAQMARMLNRASISTPRGASWNRQRISGFRQRHQLPAHDPAETKRLGLLRQDEAASRLGISPMSMHRLLKAGVVPARQTAPGLPWIIETAVLDTPAVQAATAEVRLNKTTMADASSSHPNLWEDGE